MSSLSKSSITNLAGHVRNSYLLTTSTLTSHLIITTLVWIKFLQIVKLQPNFTAIMLTLGLRINALSEAWAN